MFLHLLEKCYLVDKKRFDGFEQVNLILDVVPALSRRIHDEEDTSTHGDEPRR